jgi:hypothetical protein
MIMKIGESLVKNRNRGAPKRNIGATIIDRAVLLLARKLVVPSSDRRGVAFASVLAAYSERMI